MNYRQMIDDYLSGNMSAAEKAALENRLNADPQLKGEFDLQKNIVSSIKETRRTDLKSRLNNIRIPWYHYIPGSLKIAASVSILTVSTLSAYFYVEQVNNRDNRLSLNNDAVNELHETVKVIPKKPTVSILEENVNESTTKIEKKHPEIITRKTGPENKQEKTQSGIQIPDNKALIPQISVPDVSNEFEKDGDLDLSDGTDKSLKNLNPVNTHVSSNLDVKTIKNKKYNFHYKLSDGNLTLYGNFDENPYEILEINSNEGRRFYLNYMDHYYRLEITSQIRELSPVTDQNLINELNIVKDNK